jgi:hypothetical protein
MASAADTLGPLQAVLPIGPIPKDILHEYVQVFSRYRHVSLISQQQDWRSAVAAELRTSPGVGNRCLAVGT